MRLIRSKRGEVPDFVSDVFSFFLYILFFVLFFLLFSVSFSGCDKFETKNSKIIGEWSYKLGDEMLLQNYLRTTVVTDSGTKTFSELIAESCALGRFDGLIAETKALMKTGLDSLTSNTFELLCDPASKTGVEIYRTEISTSCPYRLHCTDELVSTIGIPLFYSGSGANHAMLVTKKCEFLVPDSSAKQLTEREKQRMELDISRCVK
jgi:hypothetical protein